jgi:hypothetical protein
MDDELISSLISGSGGGKPAQQTSAPFDLNVARDMYGDDSMALASMFDRSAGSRIEQDRYV